MRDAGACEYCGNVGAPRLIDALSLGRRFAMDVVLCDKYFDDLSDGDPEAWAWFRLKYKKTDQRD